MEKLAYIGDQPEKIWKSPITRKTYNFLKRGGSLCPSCDVDDKDIDKALSHSNTFDLYSNVKGDPDYFKKLEKRRKAKKAERAKREKAELDAQKSAAVGQVENIVNEMLEPLHAAINNLSHDMEALKDRNAILESALAATQKK